MQPNDLLDKEIHKTHTLRLLRAQLKQQQAFLEKEEQDRLLKQLPQLNQTRLQIEQLQAKAPKITKKSLRTQYAISYAHLQKVYREQSRAYEKEEETFEQRLSMQRAEIEAFNAHVERHNWHLLHEDNHVESYDPTREEL